MVAFAIDVAQAPYLEKIKQLCCHIKAPPTSSSFAATSRHRPHQAASLPHQQIKMNELDKKYREKFMDFSVRMVQLKNYLNQEKHEYNMADQVQRSGTSIGAMHREASYAESDLDFVHKLGIAQKECNETIYWLELLYRTKYISKEQFDSLYADAQSLMRTLTSSIRTVKNRIKK